MADRGFLSFVDGEVVPNGAPPYDMPADITPDFVKKLFSYPKNSNLFLPAIAADFTTTARSRLLNACRNFGGDIWQTYRGEVVKWAALTSDDGKWHVDIFTSVYDKPVQAPLIDRIVITDRNVRLVHTPSDWHTFAEFIWRYDETVEEHLNKYLAQKQLEHDQLCSYVQDIIASATSDLVIAKLVVAGPKGVEQRDCVGLRNIEKKYWQLPTGFSFIDVAADQ